MKAVFFEKPCGLEVLQYGELPTPKPQKGAAIGSVLSQRMIRLWRKKRFERRSVIATKLDILKIETALRLFRFGRAI